MIGEDLEKGMKRIEAAMLRRAGIWTDTHAGLHFKGGTTFK